MSQVPWQRIRPILDEVLELNGTERAERIEALCAEDPQFRLEVQRLVALEDEAVDSKQAARLEATSFHKAFGVESGLAPGREYGGYRIEREVGAGGMGRVYEATQLNPLRRVALKVLLPGMGGESHLKRFKREAALLARLQHPGVAQVYDAGIWADSDGAPWPFFVMEYVEGSRSLTQYAEEEQLDVRSRVRVVAEICEAVHHGHTKGVLHRDLKPNNLLVSPEGRPKVIDFGVGRAVDIEATVQAELTKTGELVGTIRYMSPEQITGAEIDARSDVYALGVVLYELLCGRWPYGDMEGDWTKLALAITQVETVRPGLLEPALRDDLEWVLVRALEKDPHRRYPTARALGEELQRYLDGFPVLASRPSLSYRARKFVSRNRTAVLVSSILAAASAGGLIAAGASYVEAERSEVRRQQAADNTRQVRRSLLASVTSLETGSAQRIRVDRMLEQASEEATSAFEGDPEGELEFRMSLTASMQSLGMHEAAEREASRALKLLSPGASASDLKVMRMTLARSRSLSSLGLNEEAIEVAEAALAAAEADGGEGCVAADTARGWLGNLLVLNLTDVARGRRLMEAARARLSETLPAEDEALLDLEADLSACWSRLGETEAALELMRSVLERKAKALGPFHPSTIMLRLDEAYTLYAAGRPQEAVLRASDAYASMEHELMPDHPLRLFALAATAFYHVQASQPQAAVDLLEPNLSTLIEVWGSDHPECLKAQDVYVTALEYSGKPELALVKRFEVVAAAREALGPDSGRLLPFVWGLGVALERAGRLEEAVVEFDHGLEIATGIYGVEEPTVLAMQVKLGIDYLTLQRPELALARARLVLGILEQAEAPQPAALAGARLLEGRSLLVLSDHVGARRSLNEAVSLFEQLEGEDSPNAAAARQALKATSAPDGDGEGEGARGGGA